MNPKSQLDRYGIEPRKSLGQNFIHDPNTLEKIVNSADLSSETTILEIGPGTGAMTELLAQRAGLVIAVELDSRLEGMLRQRLEPYANVTLVFQDILETDVASLMDGRDFVVVANVPYYITSAILRHLLEAPVRPRRLVLTMQLEVAERLIAKPGNMSLLSVSAQYYAHPRILMCLNPGVFYPRPEVTSAVVRLDTHEQPLVDVRDDASFFKVVRAGFGQRRKQLKNALAEGLQMDHQTAETILLHADIDPRRRAETLTLEEWATLTRAYLSD